MEEATADMVQTAVETIFDIHLKVSPSPLSACTVRLAYGVMQQPSGDILVFLTGREEIDRCLQELADNIHR